MGSIFRWELILSSAVSVGKGLSTEDFTHKPFLHDVFLFEHIWKQMNIFIELREISQNWFPQRDWLGIESQNLQKQILQYAFLISHSELWYMIESLPNQILKFQKSFVVKVFFSLFCFQKFLKICPRCCQLQASAPLASRFKSHLRFFEIQILWIKLN